MQKVTVTGVFLAVLFGMTFLNAVIWQRFVTDKLYHCTDSTGLPDYLFPGSWTHRPVAVQTITVSRSMSEPDTIKTGWSVAGLWCLWIAFALGSLMGSSWVAWKCLPPSKRTA